MKKQGVSGTKEWSKYSVNCVTGCSHDCRYCYAASMAAQYDRRDRGDWSREEVREKEVNRRRKYLDGRIMFPTTHDITPGNIEACVTVLRKLLEAGNILLITSKPHPDCIDRLCKEFSAYRQSILFRFTIGAVSNNALFYWEPGAPAFGHRVGSLMVARHWGFETSVSAEPLLDAGNVDTLIYAMLPHITDALWIGKMNNVRRRIVIATEEDERQVRKIEASQTDEKIIALYERWKHEPKIKWKESIKKVVGIEVPTEAGLDI